MSTEMINPIDADLCNEDGVPIGQLMIASNDETPVPVADDALVVAEANLVKTSEEDLGTDLDLYPGYEDVDKRQEAKRLFVVDGQLLAQISKKLQIPERTIAMWIYNERWDSLVRKELAVRDVQSRLELARVRTEQRNAVAASQLDQARKIRNKAMRAVEDGHIKAGADAWTAAAKIEQTILGIKEGGDIANADGTPDDDDGQKNGKQPLVMVFQGGLPQAASKRVI